VREGYRADRERLRRPVFPICSAAMEKPRWTHTPTRPDWATEDRLVWYKRNVGRVRRLEDGRWEWTVFLGEGDQKGEATSLTEALHHLRRHAEPAG